MLTKSQLIKLLVDVTAVNDLPVLDEDRNLPTEVCVREDRQTVRRMVKIVAGLLREFEYEKSPEFEEAVAGKSHAVVTMKRRLASDPKKRSDYRRQMEEALGNVLTNDAVYSLVPKGQHYALRDLADLARGLRNPD